jgi:hypothetical protein
MNPANNLIMVIINASAILWVSSIARFYNRELLADIIGRYIPFTSGRIKGRILAISTVKASALNRLSANWFKLRVLRPTSNFPVRFAPEIANDFLPTQSF